jgi:hypothetical protein
LGFNISELVRHGHFGRIKPRLIEQQAAPVLKRTGVFFFSKPPGPKITRLWAVNLTGFNAPKAILTKTATRTRPALAHINAVSIALIVFTLFGTPDALRKSDAPKGHKSNTKVEDTEMMNAINENNETTTVKSATNRAAKNVRVKRAAAIALAIAMAVEMAGYTLNGYTVEAAPEASLALLLK